MRPNDPRVIARHESAHALVLIARGIKFKSMEVFTEAAYLREADAVACGYIRLKSQDWLGEELVTRIVCSLASLSVERMLCRDVPYMKLALTSCWNDYLYAEEQCELNGYNIDRLQTVANKMVRRLNPYIRKLGDELLRRGRMNCREVMELCPEVAAEGSAFLASQQEMAA
jgi:hypothetical protein